MEKKRQTAHRNIHNRATSRERQKESKYDRLELQSVMPFNCNVKKEKGNFNTICYFDMFKILFKYQYIKKMINIFISDIYKANGVIKANKTERIFNMDSNMSCQLKVPFL